MVLPIMRRVLPYRPACRAAGGARVAAPAQCLAVCRSCRRGRVWSGSVCRQRADAIPRKQLAPPQRCPVQAARQGSR